MFATKLYLQLFPLVTYFVMCHSKQTCKHSSVADVMSWKLCPRKGYPLNYALHIHHGFEKDIKENQITERLSVTPK